MDEPLKFGSLEIQSMKVNNKVIVVTGAGSGMGRELTIQLVAKGAKVAMVDLREEGLNETSSIVGEDKVSKHVLNITVKNEVEKLPEAIIQEHGTIDGLINNAGIIQPFVEVKDLDFETIDRVMHVNFYGMMFMSKTFLPYLLDRPEAHILNVSSMGGFIPFPAQTVYSASKAAVKIFTEGLYAELKPTNVGVTVVMPGAVNTNIMANSGVERKIKSESTNKTTSAKKAASLMIEGIERNKFRVLIGKDAKMLDIFYRLSPRRAVNMIVKQMSNL